MNHDDMTKRVALLKTIGDLSEAAGEPVEGFNPALIRPGQVFRQDGAYGLDDWGIIVEVHGEIGPLPERIGPVINVTGQTWWAKTVIQHYDGNWRTGRLEGANFVGPGIGKARLYTDQILQPEPKDILWAVYGQVEAQVRAQDEKRKAEREALDREVERIIANPPAPGMTPLRLAKRDPTGKNAKALILAETGVAVKAQVRKYAGGCSMDITMPPGVDQETKKRIEELANRFQNCDFDGMIDLQTYRPATALRQAYGGANYVFTKGA